jgi:hypothetical protein
MIVGMRAAAVCLLSLTAVAAQQRVRLERSRVLSPLERACAALTVPEQRVESMHELWRAGESAIPLLLQEVRNDSEAAGPALQVLAALGGGARGAVPALQKLRAGHRRALDIGLALAAIGERDSILIAAWTGNRIVELDASGKELRKVAYQSPWGAVPLPDDHLLVTSVSPSKVEEIDWTGKVHWSAAVPNGPLDARRLPDGSTVVACWQGPCAIGLDASGKEKWRLPGIHAVDIEPLWNGHFLVCGHEDKLLVEADPTGKVVWKLPLAGTPMDADVLPNGNLLVAIDQPRQILELTREGREISSLVPPGDPEDVQRLADGRTAIADANGATLLDAEGKVLWRVPLGHSGHVVARLAPR